MDEETELQIILQNISDYLATRPNAADTAEGILHWWLKRQQFETSLTVVHQAIDILIAQGVLFEASTPGGETIYRCNSQS